MIHPAHLREEGRFERNPADPNLDAQKLARYYVQSVGLPPIRKTPYVEVDPVRCERISEVFERTQSDPSDPDIADAYESLIDEIEAQFKILPVEIIPYGDTDEPPYENSEEMMDDIRLNYRLYVYDGGSDHDFLTREQNFMLRAIHDYFGHAAHGLSFGPRGEENAWIEHSKMFTPLARGALTTETRGQNSWVNCGPYADIPARQRPYAEQKAILLPSVFQRHEVLERAYEDTPGFLETVA